MLTKLQMIPQPSGWYFSDQVEDQLCGQIVESQIARRTFWGADNKVWRPCHIQVRREIQLLVLNFLFRGF